MDEELVVSLLNTAPRIDGQVVDALAVPESAREWSADWGGVGTAEEAKVLRATRDRIRNATDTDAGPAEFWELLRTARLRPAIDAGHLSWELEAPPTQRLAIRAVLAWIEVRQRYPGRLRPCANPDCTRYLLDRSRANSARWCSMATCGNRLKARRHYARARASENQTTREQPPLP
ncbi:CGNR zinc finger domain-containing protein [Saccharopolyspora sp. K220]|uniref:CGNR zinc finger domain-containing protein n=1 Tax=Saccharopolyspora soli TaxID=2926618 RepID=UPI001F55DBD5|nr:CGNR zinc finger domain-containing protein [Saccharopolyspora soli]MCI2416422.1 CGNR zinc finger domain-containing protein [Saccharopolyspora soli]